jgi:hypothetical protein
MSEIPGYNFLVQTEKRREKVRFDEGIAVKVLLTFSVVLEILKAGTHFSNFYLPEH